MFNKLVIVVLLLVCSSVVAQDTNLFMPSSCPTGDSECCLTYNDEVCGGTSRGTCTDFTISNDVCDMTTYGWTMQWLTNFYTKICVCTDHFTGAACEECAYGWTGDNCDEVAELRVRKSYSSLSEDERAQVVAAFVAVKTTPSPFQPSITSWDWFTGIHYWAQDMNWSTGLMSVNWHRQMLLVLERLMQKATSNDAFSLPYWDWTGGDDLDQNVLVDMCGNGDIGSDSCTGPCSCPLADSDCFAADWLSIGEWSTTPGTRIQRAFGCNVDDLPSLETMSSVVQLESYTGEQGFQHLAADMHAQVHHWVGGTLSSLYAASDPLFFLHHCNVDRVFAQWIRAGSALGYSTVEASLEDTDTPTAGDSCFVAFFPLARHSSTWIMDTSALGYVYDDIETVEVKKELVYSQAKPTALREEEIASLREAAHHVVKGDNIKLAPSTAYHARDEILLKQEEARKAKAQQAKHARLRSFMKKSYPRL